MIRPVVLDAGALIALDRDNRETWALVKAISDVGGSIHVPTGVIAQAWRDGARQALLARALSHCEEVVLDGPLARAAGLLCGKAGTADVVEATVALVAGLIGERIPALILTSDPDDIIHLARTLGVDVRIELV